MCTRSEPVRSARPPPCWQPVSPLQVAERAGHSVEVLLRVYAKCLDDGEDIANTRIDTALRDA